MSSPRVELRGEELADPETAARSINALLARLYARVEAIERVAFVDLDFTTASVLSAGFPMPLIAPKWEVKSVICSQAADAETGLSVAAPPVAWSYGDNGLQIDLLSGLATSTHHTARLELRG